MDTVTCSTCSSEILADNVDPHFAWHEAQDKALAKIRQDVIGAEVSLEPATPDE